MDETTLDLRDIFKTIKKRRGIIIKIFLFMVISAVIISLVIPPTYEGETTLRVKQPKGLGDSLFANISGGSFNAKQLMSTYAEILKSRSVVQKVIDETQEPNDEGLKPRYENFIKLITTQPVKDTEILKVSVKAKSPDEAKVVTNFLVHTFINRLTELVRLEHKTVREFIGQRLTEAKKDLEQAEKALEQYKRAEKIIDAEEQTKVIMERLSTVDKLAADNRVGLSAAQAKLASAKQQLGDQNPGFIADSPLIQQYKSKLADYEVQLVSMLAKYTEKHPQVIALRAGINETKLALGTEIQRVVRAEAPSMNPIHQALMQAKLQAEAEIDIRLAQQVAINRILAEGEKQLSTLPAKERGLAQVMREAKVNQEIYVMLAKRYEEARIAEVMEPTEVQVVDMAIAPEKPIAPRKALNVVIAAMLGLMLGTGTAFVQEYLNKSIYNAEDVREYLDLPVLGSIPDFTGDEPQQNKGTWRKLKDILGFAETKKHKQLYRG